jgi:hypothetical protein
MANPQQIIRDGNRLNIVVRGKIDIDVVRSTANKVGEALRAAPASEILVDLSSANAGKISFDDLNSERPRHLVPGTRVAFFVVSDHIFGLAHIYASVIELIGCQAEVFRNRDEALRWLAREKDTPN